MSSDPIPFQVDDEPMRLWYLRRGVAWQPVLGCCAAAAVAAALLARWPSTAVLLLPLALAALAAGAAFLFDEASTRSSRSPRAAAPGAAPPGSPRPWSRSRSGAR